LADIALRAAQAVNIQVAGVDIVENEVGMPIIFEVNSCPGFTLDETVSDEIRILSSYLAKLSKKEIAE
jgi:glutathione synthase/RimK-type ligase-like ATP-grasp enzyme